jgi:hypothetical protein
MLRVYRQDPRRRGEPKRRWHGLRAGEPTQLERVLNQIVKTMRRGREYSPAELHERIALDVAPAIVSQALAAGLGSGAVERVGRGRYVKGS